MRSSSEAATLPSLGVGVVWWPQLDPLCRLGEGLVHVIEAEPETFWIPHPGPQSGFRSQLPLALRHLPGPKLLHGVGAPFGGAARQSAAHVETISGDISALRPAWISDHLSFNQYTRPGERGPGEIVCTGFFLPPAQCREGVSQAAAHIKRRRLALGVPVAFENSVSYLPPRPGEMPDGDFVAEVAEAADCGILLDLHNLLCNERNGRQTVEEFCQSIPLERVWEIHLAGGQAERGFWLDAHSGLVEPALMEILTELVPHLPALGAIIFEIMPGFIASVGLSAIGKLLGQLNDIWAARRHAPAPPNGRRSQAWIGDPAVIITPSLWESAIGSAVTGLDSPQETSELAGWTRCAEASLELYRYLAQEGRASCLVDMAPRTIRSLLIGFGEARTRQLLARFWQRAAPAYTTAEEGRTFLDFLSVADVLLPGLHADIAGDRNALTQLAAASQ
jgi:uncharacterized protein (UPF0276 family)